MVPNSPAAVLVTLEMRGNTENYPSESVVNDVYVSEATFDIWQILKINFRGSWLHVPVGLSTCGKESSRLSELHSVQRGRVYWR